VCIHILNGKWLELSTPKVGRYTVHGSCSAHIDPGSKGQGHTGALLACQGNCLAWFASSCILYVLPYLQTDLLFVDGDVYVEARTPSLPQVT